ncbi:ADP-ribosyl-[dinitrogen reductase] hydrolase [Methylomonas sp. LW13]|uniref:ADP-ribosyl-[dinitrogen reductase] hydrolase n=1 Tax=Methylomonas defluvii TaxID=3045149 RepID=A0ABU4UA62_9GAMM|nr:MULTISPECIES: ADP-ribosyl-[dinitrogen reductase] hydrolase [unclassified Methylomonas]MDX8126234.1 ADP-ribosyl-[dinitrogen reductase] hydrolase [Methylomonas sp. OY6]PKD41704.1 ADP-ribosyl-[dinitrogen reductase] hydrolase [Methylomonas sp. Kb3]QBC26320.1 ADP-ribosyl-[dinitrogen reductase] hydrolase [Methylomonas sp. LW13]
MNEQLMDRALGAYLGFACGDALGATVEFMSPKQIQSRYGVHTEMIGGGWLGLEPGQVTDDTQMSLALGRAIIEHQGWNLKSVADNFLAWLESDPPDVGNTCRRGLVRYRDEGVLMGLPREDDAGNGACMRNLPVVLATLNRPDDFELWSLEQSHITHHNPLSDAATLALGRMTNQLIHGQPVEACLLEAKRLINQYSEFAYHPYPSKASAYIVDTTQTVLHYFFNTDNFESCLIATVNQGGDADTTGALAGMLAGAKYGLAQIPERWLAQLDSRVGAEIRGQVAALIKMNN